METMKSRLEDVHGWKETHKPEQMYHDEQKIIEMEIEETKNELQDDQRCYINESGGEQLEQFCTMFAGVQKQNLASKTEEKWKIINKWISVN